jgi:hypothetical protein
MTCWAATSQVPKQPGRKRNGFNRCLWLSSAIHARQVRWRSSPRRPASLKQRDDFSQVQLRPRPLLHPGGSLFWLPRRQRKMVISPILVKLPDLSSATLLASQWTTSNLCRWPGPQILAEATLWPTSQGVQFQIGELLLTFSNWAPRP